MSEDDPSPEQSCFVYPCSKAVEDARQWVAGSRDREWPNLHSPFSFQIDPVMEGPEKACEADASPGSMVWSIVNCDYRWRWPNFDSRFYDLAVSGMCCREFWRFEPRDSAGGADATAATDLFEGQSSRPRSLGFIPVARKSRHVASLEVHGVRVGCGLCLCNRR
jgi:hypothetical protein